MLKKTITFEDLNGNTLTEDFYFNLSQAEVAKMELSHTGGLSDYLKLLISTSDGKNIIATFEEIILTAYGQRSPDGRRFIKSPEISKEFVETDAYSVLFMELITDAVVSSAFIEGILPKALVTKMHANEVPSEMTPETLDSVPKRPRDMSREELLEAFTNHE